jgi:predicted transcriptional regulator
MERGFIKDGQDNKKRKVIMLTENGHEYLKKYKVIIKFIEDFSL